MRRQDLEWSADGAVAAVEGGKQKLVKAGVIVERQTVDALWWSVELYPRVTSQRRLIAISQIQLQTPRVTILDTSKSTKRAVERDQAEAKKYNFSRCN